MTDTTQTATNALNVNVKRTGKVWKEPEAKRNYTSVVADLFSLSSKAMEAKAGQIFMVANHTAEIGELAMKIKAMKNDESVRKACIDFIEARPEGETVVKRQRDLAALGKNKNKLQRREYEANEKMFSRSRTLLENSCDCWHGLQRIIFSKCEYSFDRIESVTGANVWTFHIWRNTAQEREWLQLSAKQLAAAASATFTPATSVVDIKVACSEEATDKNKTPNEEKAKGNGEIIPASKLPAAFVDLDTSIARLTKDNGIGFAAGPSAIKNAHLFWARLDALMTEKEKVAARKTFAAEADKASKRSEKALKTLIASQKARTVKEKARKAHRRAK